MMAAPQVSSFDLVNRSQPLTYKVRRLGEFCDWVPPQPSASDVAAAVAAPPPEYGSEGDELDIEDPLYGNLGGDEEAVRGGFQRWRESWSGTGPPAVGLRAGCCSA